MGLIGVELRGSEYRALQMATQTDPYLGLPLTALGVVGGALVDKGVRITVGVLPRWQGSGPIARPATNYHAEAMALLQTILKVDPADPLHLFSDNASCVLACQDTGSDLTAATMTEMPASSTAMRLRLMIRARLQRGTKTTVSWVHSHVDDPDRLQPKIST